MLGIIGSNNCCKEDKDLEEIRIKYLPLPLPSLEI